MIRKAEITIPVTNEMRDNAIGGIVGVLKNHAADRGAPVDFIEPTTQPSERLPHVTEYTWTWWTIDTLPVSLPVSGHSQGYSHRWEGVALWCDGGRSPVHVNGLGDLGIEATETLALEMLAAVHFAREKEQVQLPEPVSDVTPCLRSSNCTLTHNHRGDCELRYP